MMGPSRRGGGRSRARGATPRAAGRRRWVRRQPSRNVVGVWENIDLISSPVVRLIRDGALLRRRIRLPYRARGPRGPPEGSTPSIIRGRPSRKRGGGCRSRTQGGLVRRGGCGQSRRGDQGQAVGLGGILRGGGGGDGQERGYARARAGRRPAEGGLRPVLLRQRQRGSRRLRSGLRVCRSLRLVQGCRPVQAERGQPRGHDGGHRPQDHRLGGTRR